MSVNQLNYVDVMKDVREGVLSRYEVFKQFGVVAEKFFVIRTNAFGT